MPARRDGGHGGEGRNEENGGVRTAAAAETRIDHLSPLPRGRPAGEKRTAGEKREENKESGRGEGEKRTGAGP